MNVVKPKKTVWDKIIRVGAVLGALFLILFLLFQLLSSRLMVYLRSVIMRTYVLRITYQAKARTWSSR